MAIWHFVVSLVPKTGIIAVHGEIPDSLDQFRAQIGKNVFSDSHELFDYWKDTEISDQTISMVSERLPALRSWSDRARMFGTNKGNRIELWDSRIVCYYDARINQSDLLELFCEIAANLECVLVLKDNGKIINPNKDLLIEAYQLSIAKSFVLNPKKTIVNQGKKY